MYFKVLENVDFCLKVQEDSDSCILSWNFENVLSVLKWTTSETLIFFVFRTLYVSKTESYLIVRTRSLNISLYLLPTSDIVS